MKRIVCCLTLGLVSAGLLEPMFGAEIGKYYTNMNRQPFQGKNFVQILTEEDQQKLPRWNPEKEPSQIALLEAIRLARKTIEGKFPDFQWRFKGMNIRPWRPNSEDCWLFHISFVPTENEHSKSPEGTRQLFSFSLVVAPNGWVPEMKVVIDPGDSDEL